MTREAKGQVDRDAVKRDGRKMLWAVEWEKFALYRKIFGRKIVARARNFSCPDGDGITTTKTTTNTNTTT